MVRRLRLCTAQALSAAALLIGLTACASVRVVHEHPDVVQPVLHQADMVLVRSGDTLFAIARRHGLKVADVAAWNALHAPYTIHPGQRLRLTPEERAPTTTSMPSTMTAAGRAASHAAPSSKPAHQATQHQTATVAATSGSGRTWLWPADGTLIERAKGATPGIDIVGHAGAPVRAVADGIVLYSGSGSPGYEELIVIRHDGDWLTSYAHNRKRLVGEGQRVHAGIQIAEMGRSGANREMLTFEIRHGGELINPLTVLLPR